MRSSLIRLGATGVLAVITGCTALGDAALKSDDRRPDGADRLVSITPDLRRCAAPTCGGYYVRELNTGADREYVSKLMFDGPGLDEATIAKVKSAPLPEIVLRGHLGAPDETYHTRPFIVIEAYRGLPGKTPSTTDAFYQIGKRVPPIACFTTPCPNQIARKVNTDERDDIDDVARDELVATLLDDVWINAEIVGKNAVVAGALDQPTTRPGTQRMLRAHQVFLRLPASVGPCPSEPSRGCGDQAATFSRDENRCVVFNACVNQGVCPVAVPACPDGYRLHSWIAAPDACPAYACDPSFAE